MYEPQLEKIEETLKEFAFPRRFAVEVNADCNLACSMCHHPFMKRPKGRMPMELWRRCADQIADASPAETECWFSFCGEPLLDPELLLEMIDYGRAAGLQSQNVNTNGMLLTADIADALLASGVKVIVIGIDGHSSDVYSKLRVLGDRDLVYANVEYLLGARACLDTGPEIQVQFIEMDSNIHERDEFVKYWAKRDATVKVRNMLSWGGTFVTPMDIPDEKRIPCPWALTMMHVFWDGRVPRCPGDTEGEECPGNAWDDSLATLWGRLGEYRRIHLERRFSDLPDRCQTCQDWMTGAAKRIRGCSSMNGSACECN